DRDVHHLLRLLEERLRVAQPRLRIRAAVGSGKLRHRAAWRRSLLGRPQAAERAVADLLSNSSWPGLTRLDPAIPLKKAPQSRPKRDARVTPRRFRRPRPWMTGQER